MNQFLIHHWNLYKFDIINIFFRRQKLLDADNPQELAEFERFLYAYWKQMNSNTWNIPDAELCSKHLIRDEILPRAKNKNEEHFLDKEEIKHFMEILGLWLDYNNKLHSSKVKRIIKAKEELPIFNFKNEIINSVRSNQVCIIAGDTGCGKSTQTVQYLLSAGYTKIACTQPRRISCMSLCRRVAYETLNEYKDDIAYQIRFDSSRSKQSRVIFLTEGLLLRQISTGDELLSQYSVVIVDEVHERHLTCDLLLGLLKVLVISGRRPDLRIILMSATINVTTFLDFFENHAVLVRVPGRMYPVQLEYFPCKDDMTEVERANMKELETLDAGQNISIDTLIHKRMSARRTKRSMDATPYPRLLQLIDKRHEPVERGDLLVFLSGMAEMSSVAEACRSYVESSKRWIVLLLHSSLPSAQQDQVFAPAPAGIRKCILSTNISETAVTIDGIRFVVDSGKSKEIRWDPFTGAQTLKEYWVSRASAEQRKGRAGRTGPGYCFRLYSTETYDALVPFEEPEVLRTDLASAVLMMKRMGLRDPRTFPFLAAPPIEHLAGAVLQLHVLGATLDADIDDKQKHRMGAQIDNSNEIQNLSVDRRYSARLSDMGKLISRMPVDPNQARLLVVGSALHLWSQCVTLAAAVGLQSPFVSSGGARARGQDAGDDVFRRRRFDSIDGDAFTTCEVFVEWSTQRQKFGSAKKWCKRNFINEKRLMDMTLLREQLWRIMVSEGLLNNVPETLKDRLLCSKRTGHRLSRSEMKSLKFASTQESIRRELSSSDCVLSFRDDDEKDMATDKTAQEDDEETADLAAGDILDNLALAKCFDTLPAGEAWTMTEEERASLRLCLCSCLCPNVCVEDPSNAVRPQIEPQYQSASRDGLVMLPDSVASSHLRDVGYLPPHTVREGGRDSLTNKDRHITGSLASSEPKLFHFTGILETSKAFVKDVVCSPLLSCSLLLARRVDIFGENAENILIDGWLQFKLTLQPDHVSGTVSNFAMYRQLLRDVVQVRATLDTLVARMCGSASRSSSTSLERDGMSTKEISNPLQESKLEIEDSDDSTRTPEVALQGDVRACVGRSLQHELAADLSKISMQTQAESVPALERDETDIREIRQLIFRLMSLSKSVHPIQYRYKKIASLAPEQWFNTCTIDKDKVMSDGGVLAAAGFVLWGAEMPVELVSNEVPKNVTETAKDASPAVLGDSSLCSEPNKSCDLNDGMNGSGSNPATKRRKLGTSVK